MNGDTLIVLILLIVVVIAFVAFAARNASNVERRAEVLFERWKDATLDSAKESLRAGIKLELENWKADEEFRIRADALNRSDHTHFGKFTEHLVPWLADTSFDPRDMRFVGSPVDFVVFEGLSAGRDVTITFVEVKTGKNPRLSAREGRVREAVIAGKIKYRLLKIEKPPIGGNR